MSKAFTAAVVQAGSVGFDTPATLEKFADLASDAAGQGAKLVVFPEAFIGGYPKGHDFGARVGSRTEEGRDWFRRYSESAIDLPGPELEQMANCAGDHGLTIVAGVIERDRGTLYCTIVTLGPEGAFLGTHRKVMPTAMERLIWGFGDGSTLPVYDTELGRLGAVICWENYMPQMRLAMYGQGIELYCAPTVDDRDIWHTSMRHIAYEGRCFVLAACQFSRRGDFPDDYVCNEGNDPETVLIRGGSAIVSPFGAELAGPVYGEEAILTAEIDTGTIARGKYDLDVAGHYARPDIFSLEVDTEPKHPVKSKP